MPNTAEPGARDGRLPGLRIFRPILAGATLRERLVACVGALVGIALTGLICGWIFGDGPHIPMIVAPMGASAVLLFAVPASPLAQPWPIIGGNTISALIGVLAAYLIPDPVLAIGAGVACAIAAMSFTRCLHPPGGAAALTALIGGPAVASSGFLFPFVPVCLNSIILVGLGVAFHRLSGRRYPHAAPAKAADQTAPLRAGFQPGFQPGDVDAALAALHETLDIDRADLDRLLQEVERRALARLEGALTCGAIMVRDVVTVGAEETVERARALLLAHDVAAVPVVDRAGRLAGLVGLRELARRGEAGVAGAMTEATTAAPDDPAAGLVPLLTDGGAQAVVVTAPDRRVLGIVTRTELLAALARALAGRAVAEPA